MPPAPLMQTDLPLPSQRQGKVRDVYQGRLRRGLACTVLVATDRLSAFDVVMPNAPAGKGQILTSMAKFWFDHVADELGQTIQHHALSFDVHELDGLDDEQRERLRGRVTLGVPCRVVPIECVVRGYLAGSGWRAYHESGSICGVALPPGLQQGEALPEPIFTPATKAEEGHDENIDFETACSIAGEDVMHSLREQSLAVYRMAHQFAQARGVILADTKFEFGFPLENQGDFRTDRAILIDEVLTPDSSRYWPAEAYAPGQEPASMDKQFVRDHLQALVDAGSWNKQPPGPMLPDDVLQGTMQRYREAYTRLTDQPPPA